MNSLLQTHQVLDRGTVQLALHSAKLISMARFIAFLRAINVGGHVVRMGELRKILDSLGFVNVQTFIASGNLVFETKGLKPSTLEKKIEQQLGEALGYEVATFVRTQKEVLEIAEYNPFAKADVEAAVMLNISFLAEPLDESSKKNLMALKSEYDDFHVHKREVYWLSRRKFSESIAPEVSKILGKRSTSRGANTVKRIAEKHCLRKSI
jgi:uncharacterized protein (DUF1697 family)